MTVARRLTALLLLVLSALLGGCSALPPLDGRSESHALPPHEAQHTRLGQKLSPLTHQHPKRSGIIPLADGHQAFAVRMQLAEVAEQTLDIQYYLWKKDLTGTLLLEALREAAERGVRVRLLLDDNHALGLDPVLHALNQHPQIQIRLFNPFVVRSSRTMGFITDFPRANRRMHNKAFTVDNQVTIIGGRNIGDEYFAAADGLLFADLDVLAIGPVVQAVSADFDRYWMSDSSYPAELMLATTHEYELRDLVQEAVAALRQPEATDYATALHLTPYITDLLQDKITFTWAPTRMISDDPAKGLGLAEPEALIATQLEEITGGAEHSLDLVSPYFVPTASGVAALSELASRGVRIRILTNSLEATDVAWVHVGYAKRRKALLRAGITLFETRRLQPKPDSGKEKRERSTGPFGSSGSSLHAKTFAVDGKRVFVGSFNFDPRSTDLNTELGFVMESPYLAEHIASAFEHNIPNNAYQVKLDEQGRLYWLEWHDGKLIHHRSEPGTGFWRRLGIRAASWLPIEWLL